MCSNHTGMVKYGGNTLERLRLKRAASTLFAVPSLQASFLGAVCFNNSLTSRAASAVRSDASHLYPSCMKFVVAK